MYTPKDRYKIHSLEVLKDNIVWIWTLGEQAVVVDPAVTEPVKAFLQENGLHLIAVLQTHHHADHIEGTEGLVKEWSNAEVIASKADSNRIPFQTISVNPGDTVSIIGKTVKILGVSGHTRNHIAFYLPKGDLENNNPVLFCGDALFGAGCGKLFEGTPEDLFIYLNSLNSLPAETEIYCAHEYTVGNLRWAQSLYPHDQLINRRLYKETEKRRKGLITLPSSISEERKTNLFLRARSIKELADLRQDKDRWSS